MPSVPVRIDRGDHIRACPIQASHRQGKHTKYGALPNVFARTSSGQYFPPPLPSGYIHRGIVNITIRFTSADSFKKLVPAPASSLEMQCFSKLVGSTPAKAFWELLESCGVRAYDLFSEFEDLKHVQMGQHGPTQKAVVQQTFLFKIRCNLDDVICSCT